MNPKYMPGYTYFQTYEDDSEQNSEADDVNEYVYAMNNFSFETKLEVYVEPNKRSRIAKIVKGERLTGKERLERVLFGGEIK